MRATGSFDTNAIMQKQVRAKALAQAALSAAVITDCTRFVPMRDGYLQKSVRTANDNKAVEWNTPYARYVYYMGAEHISVQKNPNARPEWFEWAKAQQLKSWIAIVDKTIKENMA